MQIQLWIRAFEHPMLEPLRLSNPQDVAGGFQVGQVLVLVRRIGHLDHDVDHRLGREAGNGSGTGVLDPQGAVSQCRSHSRRFPLEQHGLLRIVIG